MIDERDRHYIPIDTSQWRNDENELVTVYFNVTRRMERYTYDAAGRRVTETVDMYWNDTHTYRYYGGTSKVMTDGRWAYRYDAAGNRVGKSRSVVINTMDTPIDEIPESFWNGVGTSVDGLTLGTAGEHWRYEYSLRNQMTAAYKNGELVATFRYDARGLRVATEKPDEEDTTYTVFGTAGEILVERTGATQREYVYHGGYHLAASTGVVNGDGRVTITETVYLHTDQVGSITGISDEAGGLVWNGEYTPFGSPALPDMMSGWGWVFGGKGYDGDVELYYFNARWYDAGVGSFTSEDPARDGGNWYAYVAGNPLVYIDPTGLWRTREERQADRRERQDDRRERQEERERQRDEQREAREGMPLRERWTQAADDWKARNQQSSGQRLADRDERRRMREARRNNGMGGGEPRGEGPIFDFGPLDPTQLPDYYAFPVEGSRRVTSGYGPRIDPFTGQPRFHYGVDIGAAAGSNVVAVADGVVLDGSSLGPNYGGRTVLAHPDGSVTVYGHVDPESTLAPGTTVSRGQKIAEIADHESDRALGGRSTGSHLHFELRVRGIPQDPTGLLDYAY